DVAAAAERRARALVLSDEAPHLIDSAQAGAVRLFRRFAPGEQAMVCQQDPVATGIFCDCSCKQETQFEARTQPWNPHDVAPEPPVEFPQLVLAVGSSRDGDRPVRMEMIDVPER